jgi:hypothetical protein
VFADQAVALLVPCIARSPCLPVGVQKKVIEIDDIKLINDTSNDGMGENDENENTSDDEDRWLSTLVVYKPDKCAQNP